MVRFQVLSDIHLEVYKNDVSYECFLTPVEDYLILGGDICHINFGNRLEDFLIPLCKKFRKVYYVLGNHEFYKTDGWPIYTIQDVYNKFYDIAKKIDNLMLLDQKYEIIEDVCIAGCTLWSYTDYIPKWIVRIKGMNAPMYRAMHCSDVNWIEEMIIFCKRKDLKLLMITHYPPTLHALSKHRYSGRRDRFSSLYATDLSRLLSSKKVHTWIFGHVHRNFDYYGMDGTRIVSNQAGKPSDVVTDFSLEKIIEI